MTISLPDTLRSTGRFCLWRYEERDGCRTKVPYTIKGWKAKASQIEDFAAYEDACTIWEQHPEQYSGLGIGMFGDLVGIDIDHCVEPDGSLNALAEEVVDRIGSYAELSPSGEGVHVLCCAPGLTYGQDVYYVKNSRIGLEIYVAGQTSRYLTVTGKRLNDLDLAPDCSTAILEIARKHMRRGSVNGSGTAVTKDFVASRNETVTSTGDADVLALIRNSKDASKFNQLYSGEWSGYPSQSEADMAFANILAFYTRGDIDQCERIFRSSGLIRPKFDQRGHYNGEDTYGRGTIALAIRSSSSFYDPNYRSRSAETRPLSGIASTTAITPEETTLADIAAALAFLREHDVAHSARYTRNDLGGGYLLADYLKPTARPLVGRKGAWMQFDGRHWCDDSDGINAENGAKALGSAVVTYTNDLPESERETWLKWAGRWMTRKQRTTFINDARSVYPVSRADFDTDPMLLNCPNGTLDLRTLQLRPHDPDDLLTQLTGAEYDENASSPLWENTLTAVLTDEETRRFYQRWCGYCLTGLTKEEAIVILYGRTSRNGKSTLAESIAGTLGDYSTSAQPATISETSRHDSRGPSEDVARLRGKRLVTISEPPQSMTFDAALLKTLTGGDTVTARFLNENSFEFQPMFKIVVNTNYLPRVNDLTLFRSGRITVIPFEQRFTGERQDKDLKLKLAQPGVRAAILNWMVRGLQDYLHEGLRPSAAMKDALGEYEMNSDKVGRFIEERLIPTPGRRVILSSVYSDYQEWCRETGCNAESTVRFKEILRDHDVIIDRGRPSTGGEKTTVLCDFDLKPDHLGADEFNDYHLKKWA